MSIIREFFSFLERLRDAKTENPHIKLGRFMFKSGIGLLCSGIILNIILITPSIHINFNLNTSIGWFITIMGTVIMITSIYFSKYGLSNVEKQWKLKKLYYLRGIENQIQAPPIHALPKMALYYHETPIVLNIENKNLEGMFDDLMHAKRTIEDKVEQYQSKEVFFAGLARTPCLFFIGYSFRNAHSKITLIDHSQQDSDWFILNTIDDPSVDVQIEYYGIENDLHLNDIAVTIEYSLEIFSQELPEYLQNNLVRIKTKTQYFHNAIRSQKALERIVEKIINELIKLNKRTSRLHLFIATQSTFVFSLGRRYLDGQIGNITVYNYNPISKSYDWAISLTNNELKIEKILI